MIQFVYNTAAYVYVPQIKSSAIYYKILEAVDECKEYIGPIYELPRRQTTAVC